MAAHITEAPTCRGAHADLLEQACCGWESFYALVSPFALRCNDLVQWAQQNIEAQGSWVSGA